MNKRIPYILISVLILSVGETALAQVKVEESISTKALVKRGSRDVLRTGVIDLSRGHYRDSLVNYFTIQQGTGDDAEKNAVAVDAIVSHHLFHGNFTSARTLVDDVLYKVRTASHMSYIFLIGCRLVIIWADMHNLHAEPFVDGQELTGFAGGR